MRYSLDQWIIFFLIYCFFGWIWECSYVSIRTKKLTNRGFMRGPVLPIYGFGAVLMVFVGMPLMNHPIAMFFTGLICASTLEFFTGDIMQRLFKVRYWDYSGCVLNLKGHICLKASLAWGCFTILMNYFAHKPIERIVMGIQESVLHGIVFVLTIIFVADYSLSFKTAMELRNVILTMDKFKEEIERMEKRLDVAIAFAEDSRIQAREAFLAKVEDNSMQAKLRIEEHIAEIEKKYEIAKLKLAEQVSKEDNVESIEKMRQELLEQISEIKLNTAVMKKHIQDSVKRRGALYRNMVRNNPLTSDNFKEIIAEIKEKVNDYTK